jgi:hypothetical protein
MPSKINTELRMCICKFLIFFLFFSVFKKGGFADVRTSNFARPNESEEIFPRRTCFSPWYVERGGQIFTFVTLKQGCSTAKTIVYSALKGQMCFFTHTQRCFYERNMLNKLKSRFRGPN